MLIMTSNRREQGKPEAVAFRAAPAVALEGSVVAEVIVASCAGIAGTLAPVPLAYLRPGDSTARSPGVASSHWGERGEVASSRSFSCLGGGICSIGTENFQSCSWRTCVYRWLAAFVLSLAESSACGRSGS
jgi:hypothetical protein